jgi:hypothetical protein
VTSVSPVEEASSGKEDSNTSSLIRYIFECIRFSLVIQYGSGRTITY